MRLGIRRGAVQIKQTLGKYGVGDRASFVSRRNLRVREGTHYNGSSGLLMDPKNRCLHIIHVLYSAIYIVGFYLVEVIKSVNYTI